MSLQGSLDTFALPDVLVLLATTKKTGELRVEGDGVEGRVWVDQGDIVGGVAGRSARPVDALFELLRMTEGSFVFDQDVEPRRDTAPVSAGALLAEAQDRLSEWRSIEAVVPSMHAAVSLAAAPPSDEIILSASAWRVLVAIARGKTVEDVATTLDAGEFDACKQLKALVEQGLVELDAAAAAAPATKTRAKPADDEAKPRRTRKAPDVPARDAAAALARAALAEVSTDAAASPPLAAEPAGGDLVAHLQAIGAESAPVSAGPSDAVDAVDAPGEAEAETSSGPAAAAEAATTGAATDDDPDAQTDEAHDDEGIDRGLLLKFLSSVRT